MTNKRQQSTPPPTQPKRKKQGSIQLPTEESPQNTQSWVPLSTTSPTDSAEKSEVVMPLQGENRTQAAQSPVPPPAASSSRHPGSPASPVMKLKIFCFLLPNDGRSLFSVSIDNDQTVDDLKKAIKREKKPELDHLAADALILYKLEPSIPADLLEPLKNLKPDGSDKEVKELLPTKKLSVVFPNGVEEDHVHIVVKTPDTLNVPSPDAWLSELHSKIWGRKNLWSELFHEVDITVAHYEKLQKHLMGLQPGRNLQNYTGVNVQSIKLDILRSFKPPLSIPLGHNDDVVGMEQTEDGEDNDSLDDELRSLFPATIQYLDLSSLELSDPLRRLPLPLLIRQEYNVISKLLDDLPKNNKGSAIVSGQPGIGKTAYIHLKMIEYMIERRPFIYQTLNGNVYQVSDTFVSIDERWSPTAPITAFIDADSNTFKLQPILDHPYVQLISASSPKGASSSCWRQLADDGIMTRFVAALWSPKELFLTGIFLHSQDLTYTRLRESTSYFGFSPRRCFHASLSRSIMLQFKQNVMEKIRSIPSTTSILSLLKETYTTSGVSHSIFELSPEDDMRLLGGARVGAVSMWALDLLLTEYETRQADAAAEFFNSIAGTSSAGSLRGRIMERQVLKHFDSLKEPHIFELRALVDSSTAQWTYPGPASRVTFQSQSFTTSLQSAIDAQNPLHLVPLDPNFPAVDSILYDPGKVLTGIQVTVRNEHPIAVSGLKRLQGWLKLKSPLAHLRPSTGGDHWRLIFVVPAATAASFEQQAFERDTGGNEWAKKVDQYTLSIKEDTLWGRTVTR